MGLLVRRETGKGRRMAALETTERVSGGGRKSVEGRVKQFVGLGPFTRVRGKAESNEAIDQAGDDERIGRKGRHGSLFK